MMEKVGKYLVIEKIASGGMGTVYKAKHPTLESFMILKQLNLKGIEGVVERFKREAKIMFNFRSENIVQVYDHFREGGSYYIVMEYIDGIGLDKVIQLKRHLSNEAAVLILMEICKGLKYAHDKGVIHRDIKPANILISKEGEVKLTDFGIAKSEDDSETGLTQKGTTLGTPSYMAPEQIADSKNVDKRADIFSMGVLFYFMTTGKLPFSSDMAAKTIALIEKGKYKSPRKINPHVPARVQNIIRKMMHHRAKNRYGDLGIVITKLRPYLKKFKTQQKINDAIRNYVFGDEYTQKVKSLPKVKFFNPGTFLLKTVFSFLVIGGAIYLLYYKGLYYDVFLRDSYGKIRITVKTDRDYINNDKNYLNASLSYKGKNGNYTEYAKVVCRLNNNAVKTKGNMDVYRSDEIYLPSREYRIDLTAENEKYYREIFIEPVAVQEAFKFPSKADEIEIGHSAPPVLPMDIRFNIYDRDAETLLDDVNVSVFARSGWIKWGIFRSRMKDMLVNSRKYFFKFEKKGYLSKKLTIPVDHYETVVKLNVYLVPRAGTLFIKSNYDGLEMFLDDHTYYYTGGEDKKYVKLDLTSQSGHKYLLASRQYALTFKKGDKTKSEAIFIPPDGYKNVYVDYDVKNDQINLRIK